MRFLVLSIFVTCTACTMGPDYKRPELPLPETFQSGEDSAEAKLAADWWKLYQDPVLDGLIADGQKNNADLRQAAARVQEAEGALREIRAQFFPEIDVNATAARQRVSTLANPPVPSGFSVVRPNYQALLTTSYEIDFW
jgi:multidrug efflux system outer membrane protein